MKEQNPEGLDPAAGEECGVGEGDTGSPEELRTVVCWGWGQLVESLD